MEIKRILWTDTARNQLEDIFDYYKEKANLKSSKNLIRKLIDRTIQLEKNPYSESKEPLLQNRIFEFRYLVEVIIKSFIGSKITMLKLLVFSIVDKIQLK